MTAPGRPDDAEAEAAADGAEGSRVESRGHWSDAPDGAAVEPAFDDVVVDEATREGRTADDELVLDESVAVPDLPPTEPDEPGPDADADAALPADAAHADGDVLQDDDRLADDAPLRADDAPLRADDVTLRDDAPVPDASAAPLRDDAVLVDVLAERDAAASAEHASEPGADAPSPSVGLGVDRTSFTVAQDTRQTYFGYYWSLVPVWAQVLVIYVVSRILTTTLMTTFASMQGETWQTSASPGLVEFSNIWDAAWYERIALGGYPSELPVNDEGRITENAWAFMPVYPMLVRFVMLVTTLPFGVVTILLSLVFGLVAAYLFHHLMRLVLDGGTAMFATLLFCVAPLSPMFQVGYAESLQTVFVAALLICLVERRWALMAPLIVLASLTRPTGLAWALTLGLYFLYRWWRHRQGTLPFERRDVVPVLGLGALSVLSGFAWLLTAWVVTGDFHAYLDTELAWRSHYTGPGELIPFTAWYHAGEFWVGGVAGVVVTTLVLASFAVILAPPVMRRLGIEIRLWLVSYVVYLVAVFFPQSSVFRLLMPVFPALGVLALPRSPIVRVLLVVGSVAGQIAWITWMWFVIGHDWTPP